jgi:hypothetical protein
MTNEQQKALIAYLVAKKNDLLRGEERNGYALCIEEIREYLEASCTE